MLLSEAKESATQKHFSIQGESKNTACFLSAEQTVHLHN